MKGSNFPFHSWVPKPLGLFIYFLMFFPTLFISGTYSSNIGDMVGGLGIITEHIQFASFATAAGMVVFAPFMVRYAEIRRPKIVFLSGYITIILLSVICVNTDSPYLLVLCSFLTGFARVYLMYNALFGLVEYATGWSIFKILNPDPNIIAPKEQTDRIEMLKSIGIPFLYLFLLVVGQLGSIVTAWLAYESRWQNVYYFMIVMTLVALFLTETTMVYQKKNYSKLTFNKFGDLVIASICSLSFCFILIYGKTLDWFNSYWIKLAFAIMITSFGIFFLMQVRSRKPYLDFKIFSFKNTIVALLVFFLSMTLNGSSVLVNVFSGISMKTDNWTNALLNNYCLIGYLTGTVASVVMVKKNIHFRYIFSIGFLLITIAAVYMYFQYQSMGMYDNLKFPVIIRSAGMIIIYAMAGVWGMKNLNMRYIGTWVFLMLVFRSVVGPVTGAALYSNKIYQKQQYYIHSMSQNVDMMNPEISGTFSRTQMGAMMQGRSYEDAQILASMSVSGRIQIQATLAALKEITGRTIYGGISCIIIVLLLPYKQETSEEEP